MTTWLPPCAPTPRGAAVGDNLRHYKTGVSTVLCGKRDWCSATDKPNRVTCPACLEDLRARPKGRRHG